MGLTHTLSFALSILAATNWIYMSYVLTNVSGSWKKMTSSFIVTSSIHSPVFPCSRTMDKKFLSSSGQLSSFDSISSSAFWGRKQNVILQRGLSSKIWAMAKELHFNKDDSAIKKLQVSWQWTVCLVWCPLAILLMYPYIFSFSDGC